MFPGADPPGVDVAEAGDEARAVGAVPEDSQIGHEELVGRLDSMFNPEPEEDGYIREWPDILCGSQTILMCE